MKAARLLLTSYKRTVHKSDIQEKIEVAQLN